MNPRIRAKMFNVPATIYPLLNIDSMGDADEASPIAVKCYRMDEVEVVINSLGKEERSNTQIYLPGDYESSVQVEDLITCGYNVKSRIIKKSVFYLPIGAADVVVLYLP